MKYIPTNYKTLGRYLSTKDLAGVDLHQDYLLGEPRRGRCLKTSHITRLFVSPYKHYNVGDVLQGTHEELVAELSSRSTLNHYTRSAVLKPQSEIVVQKTSTPLVETSRVSLTETEYKGVKITVKPIVNGVLFETLDDAKKAIDVALALKL